LLHFFVTFIHLYKASTVYAIGAYLFLKTYFLTVKLRLKYRYNIVTTLISSDEKLTSHK